MSSDFVLPEKPVEPNGFVYKVLSKDQIVQQQRNIIDEVKNVLNLPPQVTRTILTHFKWNREQLFENYFESSPKEFFQRAHVLNPFEQKNPSLPFNTECKICYSSNRKLAGLGCGHSYCVACWKQYLANKTCSDGLTHTITCPADKCDIVVGYATFLTLADDCNVAACYKRLIINTFVECNTLMRWCPAPDCTHAIETNYMENKAVKCKCGHQFCFGCGENWHEPVPCSWLKKWLKIKAEDLETSIWIDQNTKDCPKCTVAIQKDGGCDHITCRNPSCHHEFCWLCLKFWKGHSPNDCIFFRNEEAERLRQAQQKSRDTKAQYQHYKDRYMIQMQRMQIERKLSAKVLAKMDEIQTERSRIEVQFLRDAVDALFQCRSTLMYSNVFAFFLKDSNQKALFEFNQKDLEVATEKISKCLEREITAKNLYDIKQEVLDLSHSCQQRRHVLLEPNEIE